MLSAQVHSKDYTNLDMVLNDEEPRVEHVPKESKRNALNKDASRNHAGITQVLNQQ